MSLEQGHELANAIKNNNNNSNNNSAIENFQFYDINLNFVAFQPVLDAILDSRVRKLELRTHKNNIINNKNNNINFTALSTNISMRELEIDGNKVSPQDRMILYDAIKINKTVEKLNFLFHLHDVLEETEKNSFKAMLRVNITLTDITLFSYLDHNKFIPGAVYDDIKKEIVIHTQLNRMWKRYKIMIREKEATAAATIAVTTNTISTNIAANVVGNIERQQDVGIGNNLIGDDQCDIVLPSFDEFATKQTVIYPRIVTSSLFVADTMVDVSTIIATIAREQNEQKMVKKKEEMVLCLQIFDPKPLIRNELLFTYLKNHTDQYIQDQF